MYFVRASSRPAQGKRGNVMKKQQGITFVEILMALAILGIVTAFSFPSFKAMIDTSSVSSVSSNLISSLSYARLEAIRRGDFVMISTSNGSNNWSDTNRVWLDSDNNNAFNTNNDEVLRLIENKNDDITVSSNGISSIAFRADGFINSPATFTICHSDEAIGRRIELLISGRVSVDDNHACR